MIGAQARSRSRSRTTGASTRARRLRSLDGHAVLKVDTTSSALTPSLGDSDAVQVGDSVVAIGNPFGLSGRSRRESSAPSSARSGSEPVRDRHVIQTDAASTTATPGGPLLNARGEVIGVRADRDGGVSRATSGSASPSLEHRQERRRPADRDRQGRARRHRHSRPGDHARRRRGVPAAREEGRPRRRGAVRKRRGEGRAQGRHDRGDCGRRELRHDVAQARQVVDRTAVGGDEMSPPSV